MITTLLMIAGVLFLALLLEEKLKVPTPLGLIALSFIVHYTIRQAPILTGDATSFSDLVIFLLPILLISDCLELKRSDLKEQGLSLLYLSVISVTLSILVGIAISGWLFADYAISTAGIVLLFAMVLATDPVSVVSIFSKFDLPHRLKILAEGESLFNDATAIIVFVFIGLFALGGGEITATYVTLISIKVIVGSVVVGLVVGFAGLVVMKTTKNRTAEMMILLLTGYGAFLSAEYFYVLLNLLGEHSHLHLSGILSCICATITVNHVMTKSLSEETEQIGRDEAVLQNEATRNAPSTAIITVILSRIKATVEERDRHLRTKEDIQLLALAANTVLFVAMAEMIDLPWLWQYKTEIIAMFLATTVIRAAMMGLFALLANRTSKMVNIDYPWWNVLTFAGIKGGLSIVMLAMIPATFKHLEMFKAVVIGVILLSTFIYSIILLVIIKINQQRFLEEKKREAH